MQEVRWYHSLTAHQHQKGHTVPKQVIMIAKSIQVATVSVLHCVRAIRYQAKSEQNVRQDLILVKLNASGNSGVFPIFKNLVPRKWQVLEWKIHLHCRSLYYPVVCGHVFHLVKAEREALVCFIIEHEPPGFMPSHGGVYVTRENEFGGFELILRSATVHAFGGECVLWKKKYSKKQSQRFSVARHDMRITIALYCDAPIQLAHPLVHIMWWEYLISGISVKTKREW